MHSYTMFFFTNFAIPYFFLCLASSDRLRFSRFPKKKSCVEGNEEGVNGVNRLSTKGEKILLITDKTRKKLPTCDKKLTEIYWQPTKVENFNWQPTK